MSLGGREFVSNAGVQDLARDSSQGVWDVSGEAQKVVLGFSAPSYLRNSKFNNNFVLKKM